MAATDAFGTTDAKARGKQIKETLRVLETLRVCGDPHSPMHKPYILAHDTGAPTTIAVCDIGAFEQGPLLYFPLVRRSCR